MRLASTVGEMELIDYFRRKHRDWWGIATPITIVFFVAQKDHSLQLLGVVAAVYWLSFFAYYSACFILKSLFSKFR